MQRSTIPKDLLLVFDLIQLLLFAGCKTYMLGDCAVVIICSPVSCGAPCSGAFCLEQSFLCFRACHSSNTPFVSL